MKNVFFVSAWLFIVLVAVYDIYFAWHYRACFHVWELNPLARWTAQAFGMATLFAFKMTLLSFSAAVAAYCHRRQHHLDIPYTLCISAIPLLLSLHYLVGTLHQL